MDELRKRVIRDKWKYICDNLVAEDLIPCLYQVGVVSKQDEERIKNESTTTEKVNKLLRILEAKPSFDAFLHALEENYSFIKDELQKREKELIDEYRHQDVEQLYCRSEKFMTPGKPIQVEASTDSITIKWDFNEDELLTVDNFEIKYRIKGGKGWPGIFPTKSNDCSAKISQLQANAAYEFRVRANYGDEEGEMSLISDPISTKYPDLEKPIEHFKNDCEISVKWFKLPGCEIEKYEMGTKMEDDSTWESVPLDQENEIFTKQNLFENMEYQFRVCAVTKKGPCIYSDVCRIQTLYPTPNKPNVVDIKGNSIKMKVNIEKKYEADIKFVKVEYKEINWEKSDWQSRTCEVCGRCFEVSDLLGDTTYVFKVQVVYNQNVSSFSAESYPFTTKRDRPTKPQFVYRSSHRISVNWKGPEGIDRDVSFYEVYSRQENVTNWTKGRTSKSELYFTTENLHSATNYVFKVCAVFGEERGLCSPESEPIKTDISLANDLKAKSKKRSNISGTKNMYDVYQIPLKDISLNESARYRTCAFGKYYTKQQYAKTKWKKAITCVLDIHATNEFVSSEERTLMLVGGTGAGKSLMVETFINYILDVDFSDDFRFSLVDLNESERRKVDNQSVSQTEWITMYQIGSMDKSRVSYKMNIIDTPGFGDTSGTDEDDRLIESIETFFKSDNNLSIDAIGFVIEAPQCRLNDGQKKLFENIFSIFGKDFDRNIFLFVTFSDEFEPNVMAAIRAETIPFAGKYKFNNGGLFVNCPKSKESFEMAFSSLSEFFDHLNMARGVSLKQTTDNMEKKRQLTATVEGLKPQIQVGYHKLESLRQQVKVLEKHKADVKKNKDFEFTVDLPCKEKIKTGYWSTNCKTCEVTCHHPCWHTSDKWNVFCKVMSQSKCTVCEGKCNSWDHEMSEYTYFDFVKKTKQSFHDLVQKYERVIGGPEHQEKVINALKKDIMDVWVQIGKAVEKISRLIEEINRIALRRVSYSATQYIDKLMAEENSKGEVSIPGKMALLTILRIHAETMLKRRNTPNWEDIDVDDMLQSWKHETKKLKRPKS